MNEWCSLWDGTLDKMSEKQLLSFVDSSIRVAVSFEKINPTFTNYFTGLAQYVLQKVDKIQSERETVGIQ